METQKEEPTIICDCGNIISVNDISQEDLDNIKRTHHPIITCRKCGRMIFIMVGE